jgi:hypothetical protein
LPSPLVAEKATEFLQRWGAGDEPDPEDYLAIFSNPRDRREFEAIVGMGKILSAVLR